VSVLNSKTTHKVPREVPGEWFYYLEHSLLYRKEVNISWRKDRFMLIMSREDGEEGKRGNSMRAERRSVERQWGG
jgi:hypothetical protein